MIIFIALLFAILALFAHRRGWNSSLLLGVVALLLGGYVLVNAFRANGPDIPPYDVFGFSTGYRIGQSIVEDFPDGGRVVLMRHEIIRPEPAPLSSRSEEAGVRQAFKDAGGRHELTLLERPDILNPEYAMDMTLDEYTAHFADEPDVIAVILNRQRLYVPPDHRTPLDPPIYMLHDLLYEWGDEFTQRGLARVWIEPKDEASYEISIPDDASHETIFNLLFTMKR